MKKKMRIRSIVVSLSVYVFLVIFSEIYERYSGNSYSGEDIALNVINILLIYILVKAVVLYPKTQYEYEIDNLKNKKRIIFLLAVISLIFIVLVCFWILQKKEVEVFSIVQMAFFVLLTVIYSIVLLIQKDGIYGDFIFISGTRIHIKNMIEYVIEEREILLQYKKRIGFIRFNDIISVRCKYDTAVEISNILKSKEL